MDHATIISELGRHAGVPGLSPDDSGRCRLIFEGKAGVGPTNLDMEWEEEAGALHLYVVLGPVTARDGADIFRALLGRNLFGAEGVTYAVDDLAEEFVAFVTLRLPAASTAAAVSEALLAAAERWETGARGATPHPEVALGPPNGFGLRA